MRFLRTMERETVRIDDDGTPARLTREGWQLWFNDDGVEISPGAAAKFCARVAVDPYAPITVDRPSEVPEPDDGSIVASGVSDVGRAAYRALSSEDRERLRRESGNAGSVKAVEVTEAADGDGGDSSR